MASSSSRRTFEGRHPSNYKLKFGVRLLLVAVRGHDGRHFFFFAVEIPPIGEFQLRLKLKPRGTLEWNSSIQRDGHFQHWTRCVGWQQLKLRYLPTMDPLHCFRLVKRLADGIDTIVALAAGLAKSIRRPVGLFRQQSRCITRT